MADTGHERRRFQPWPTTRPRRRSNWIHLAVTAVFIVAPTLRLSATALASGQAVQGTQLDPSALGPGLVESMEAAVLRDEMAPVVEPDDAAARQGRQGVWIVPGRRTTYFPHSGIHNVVNKWGDTRMGIQFPSAVDVQGAFVAGQGGEGAWTNALRVVGYLADEKKGSTPWFTTIGTEPAWFAIDLPGVDRIVFESRPVVNGAGWYALDDLSFKALPDDGSGPTVLDFEDLEFKTQLTGSGYAGLTWEFGEGDFGGADAVPPPRVPPGTEDESAPAAGGEPSGLEVLDDGTLPTLNASFQGVIRGDAGSFSFPPDTMGAASPNYFVITVNRNFAVYDKQTGAELINIHLGAFLPGSSGDPRVLFDHHSERWVVIVSDFQSRIYLAFSLTDDPLGDWFKTSFVASQGADSGTLPDYPTLGVDARGIYISAYMYPLGMSIFAIAKPPLLGPQPSLGTVTAFRGLAYQGAIQPAHIYGDPGGALLVSRAGPSHLAVRRIVPPLTAPLLVTEGQVSIPVHVEPPDAPALGSLVRLDTVGHRLMMSVYRDGSLWTCHTVGVGGRAACRWYEIDVATLSLRQWGTVADPSLHYFFPSINVNRNGHVAMGFSGSNADQFAAAYYTGRQRTDPLGAMAPPVLLHAGAAPQNNIDDYGRNRWGDYSYTTLDPADGQTIWTIQEYAHDNNIWGTWVASLDFDCNENGVDDAQDVASGTSEDCNANQVPDECEPDEDCNNTNLQDICDIAAGTSVDCDGNDVPDECDPDADCNGNGIQDICDIAAGDSGDCNINRVPDECDVSLGTSGDCNANLVPDECEPDTDCNGNGVTDICDVALGTSPDCNGNQVPDECDIFRCGPPIGVCPGTGDCCGPAGNGTPGCDCAVCCHSVCEYDFFCCEVQWDDICAASASHDPNCACSEGAFAGSLDCNNNDVPDECDIDTGYSEDCNANVVPDSCEPDEDCNANGIQDICDIGSANSLDCNANDVPDECESQDDCNGNGVQDICDLAAGTSSDCNANGVLDECDLALGTSGDCNGNAVPDECESTADCNGNGTQDFCDIATGTSPDCNANDVPDECDIFTCGPPTGSCPGTGDCCNQAGNGTAGCDCARCCGAVCEVDAYCCNVVWDDLCAFLALWIPDCDCGGPLQQWSQDCNANDVPDECDIESGYSEDCNANGIPDTCDPNEDCNGNGVQDVCDIADTTSTDCNENEIPDECEPSDDCNDNGVPDFCDIATGSSDDCNLTNVPDECEISTGVSDDCNANGVPDECDIASPDALPADDCIDAKPVCPGLTYTGTTVGATSDGFATCAASAGTQDVWYRYTPPTAGLLSVSLCDSSYDTALSVHTGCPGTTENQIVCNDDACGLQSVVALTVDEGLPYWIRVSGYSGATGDFTMTLEGPDCSPNSADCNGNGIPDECDIADCAGDPACADCDGNGVPDVCDPDCNTNGRPDTCDLAEGTSEDCDGNDLPDECQRTHVTWTSPVLSPIGWGSPQEFVIHVPPVALSDVTLSLAAVGDFAGSSQTMIVRINGQIVGSAFALNAQQCPAQPDVAEIVVPVQDFYDLVSGTDATIQIVTSGLVHADACTPPSYAIVGVAYDTVADCNANGVLDFCDIDQGLRNDCNSNGLPDECEADCNGNGLADECEPNEDCNANDVQDICDIAAGVSDDCDLNDVPDECQPDADRDGVPDVCDPCPDDYLNDQDGDGWCDSQEQCPLDPEKTMPGQCGCGVPDADNDGDGVAACNDLCNGVDDAVFGPECEGQVPAVSDWGLVVLGLLLLVAAKLYLPDRSARHRQQ